MSNNEFKPMKNAIIQEALKISKSDKPPKNADSNEVEEDIPLPMPPEYDVPTPPPERLALSENKNCKAATGTLRLLKYLGKILQDRIDENKIVANSRVDRKLYRKIQDKKQAHGLKQ